MGWHYDAAQSRVGVRICGPKDPALDVTSLTLGKLWIDGPSTQT
jgi:hypothetical protein